MSWDPACQFRIDLRQVAAKKFLRRLLVRDEFRRRHDQTQTNDLLVDRNEPGPVKLLFVKDEGIILRHLAGRSRRRGSPL